MEDMKWNVVRWDEMKWMTEMQKWVNEWMHECMNACMHKWNQMKWNKMNDLNEMNKMNATSEMKSKWK